MAAMDHLTNTSRPAKGRKRVGRGPGSGLGKTSGRGQKGAGARSGYKRRWGYEGGQMRLFMKLPQRGFSNVRFQKKLDIVNIKQIEQYYSDGEVVNMDSLRLHGLVTGKSHGIKILGNGEITKKVTIDVDAISAGAEEKLRAANIQIAEKNN